MNFECNVVHVQCTSIVVILTPPKVMVLSWQTRLNHDTTFTTISARYGVHVAQFSLSYVQTPSTGAI